MESTNEHDPFDDEIEPIKPTLSLVDGLSEKQKAWVRLLTIIADDFPASEFGKMAPGDIQRVGLSWCDKLPNVATGQVNALYGRVIRDRENSYPPNIAELAAEWNKWQREEYAERREQRWNERETQVKTQVYPESQPAVNLAWARRMREHKGVVSCNCTYRDGTPVGASMVNLDNPYDTELRHPTHWVCTAGVCNYQLPVGQTEAAPCTKPNSFGNTLSVSAETSTSPEKPAKPQPRKLSFFERVIEAWNIDTEAADPMSLLKLRLFVNRWQAEHGNDKLPSPDDFTRHQQASAG